MSNFELTELIKKFKPTKAQLLGDRKTLLRVGDFTSNGHWFIFRKDETSVMEKIAHAELTEDQEKQAEEKTGGFFKDFEKETWSVLSVNNQFKFLGSYFALVLSLGVREIPLNVHYVALVLNGHNPSNIQFYQKDVDGVVLVTDNGEVIGGLMPLHE